MFKLRLAILGAAAALAFGTAGAMAMTEAGTGDSDSHGDAVASAARNCPHGASGVHGACVSAIASTNGEANSSENDQADQNGKSTAPGQVCKTVVKGGSKADHRAFAACVVSHASAHSGS